jgi:glutathione S-transferase
MSTLRVFTFTPDWGLPSAGPFAIKLLAWLQLAGVPYEQVIEDNPRKGPKGKNPWIELDGEPIGDTELIIELLSKRYGVDLDAGLSSEQKAIGLAWRRTFEEHFHQVLEWELFEHPAGATYMRKSMLSKMPPVIGPLVFSMLRSHLRKQLYARGLARHTPDIIEAKGRADIDALAAFLGDKPLSAGAAAKHSQYGGVRFAGADGVLAHADARRFLRQIRAQHRELLRPHARAML